MIKGRKGKDRIKGKGGDDILIGGKGSDFLKGGPGTDKLFGGTPGATDRFQQNDICVAGEPDQTSNCNIR